MKAWLLDQIGDGVGGLRIGMVTDPEPATRRGRAGRAVRRPQPGRPVPGRGAVPGQARRCRTCSGATGSAWSSAVGPDVTGVRPGDRRVVLRSEIGVNRPGTFARAGGGAGASRWWPCRRAGPTSRPPAAPLVYLTAYQALTPVGRAAAVRRAGHRRQRRRRGRVRPTGGGPGAHRRRPLAIRRKRDHLERLGAAHALDPTEPDWPQTLKKLLAAGGWTWRSTTSAARCCRR